MAVSKHKSTVYLANEPFRVKTYLRSITDDLVARFGSAEQGQTNLDLLKAETQKSFKGGMFQRMFDDPEMVSSITGGHFNPMDDQVYLSPAWDVVNSTSDMGPAGVESFCVYKGELYYSFHSVALVGKIHKIDLSTHVITAVTIPAALQAATYLRLCAYDTYMFVSADIYLGDTTNAYRYNGTTFTDVGGFFIDFVVFRGRLYGMGIDNAFYQITNHTSTPIALSSIGFVGPVPASGMYSYQRSMEFNGRLYFGMSHGLYAYDGVAISPVLNYLNSPDLDNFVHLAVFNGRLYYNIKNRLFEFDGINIRMLQDFSEGYSINFLSGAPDRLWVGTRNSNGTPYSDKFGSGFTYTHSAFIYDGVGFFEYRLFPNEVFYEYIPLVLAPAHNKCFAFVPAVTVGGGGSPTSAGYNVHIVNLANEFTTDLDVGQKLIITSSIQENGYPSVPKTLNGVMLEYDGIVAGDSKAKLEIQYRFNGVWSSWVEVWNTLNVAANGASNDYPLHEQVKVASPNLTTEPLVYHGCRYRLTIEILDALTDVPRVRSQTMRYTLQQRTRRKWLLTLQLRGADSNRNLNTPTLSDGNQEIRSASELRKIIYDAHTNKKPILFYDADYTEVKTITPSIKIHGTHFAAAGDNLAIQDTAETSEEWVNRRLTSVVYDEVNLETVIALDLYGYRDLIGGSAAGSYAIGAQVRKSYAVYVKDIRGERYLLDENTLNNYGKTYSDIASEVTVELVEV